MMEGGRFNYGGKYTKTGRWGIKYVRKVLPSQIEIRITHLGDNHFIICVLN